LAPTAVPEFVVVALSAQALPASACRSGRSGRCVAGIDLFADADTAAMVNTCLNLPTPPSDGMGDQATLLREPDWKLSPCIRKSTIIPLNII